MKLRWREIQSLHVLATDLTTGWIGVLSPLGLDGETRVGRGMTHYIDDHLVPNHGLPLRLVVPSPMGKWAHACLLFRINRNDRLPRTLKHFHTAVDRAKLGIPIGMRRPLSCLARAL